MEIILELTQEDADKVAIALEVLRYEHQHLSFDGTYEQLLSDVAQAFRNATRDAKRREADDDMHAWMNKEN